MQKVLWICLFSIYLWGANETPKWTIADIYSMAQQATVTNLDYPIYHQTMKEDKWVSITTAWNDFIDATVDIKNSALYILDEGTGGGSFSTQAALWRDDTGSFLLIVAENGYDFTFPEKSVLKAFQYIPIPGRSSSLGIQLISPPLPDLSLLDFMPEGMSMKDLHILAKTQPTIFYKLPREGSSIHALLVVKDDLEEESILKRCYYDKKTCIEKEKIYRYYYQHLKGKIYRDIELSWKEYRFEITKKSRKTPGIKDIWPDQ